MSHPTGQDSCRQPVILIVAEHLALIDYLQPNCPLSNALSVEDLLSNNAKHVPIIMLADQSDLSTRLIALRAGIKAYITKPLDKDELLEKIEHIVARRQENQIKVLMVDDDITLTEFYYAALSEEGFCVECTNNPLDVLEHIETFKPDVICLDYQMPECSGLEVAEILRGDPRYMKIPIVFISSSDEAYQKKGVINLVGHSFLRKPVEIEELSDTLSAAAAKAKKVIDNIDKISVRQSVHNLQNRDYFLQNLEESLQTSEFSNSDNVQYYLTMVTTNFNAEINKSWDEKNQNQFKQSLESYFSCHPLIDGQGCVFREDSFLLLLENNKNENKEKLLNDFYEELKNHNFIDRDLTESLPYKISTIELNDNSPTSTEKIISLLEKNHLEKNQLSSVSHKQPSVQWVKVIPTLKQESILPTEEELDQKIIQAIKDQSFQLAYQPIIKPECEDHIFEVLVRLVDEDGEIYLPDRFLPYLENVVEDGYYILDRWVIEHAFRALDTANGKGSSNFSIIIKLWPDIKQMERLLPFVFNMLSNSHFRGSSQSIYFSSSAQILLSDLPKAKHILESLNKAHCGFMIDHWLGTEDSIKSIASLKYVNFIKLDPSYQDQLSSSSASKNPIEQLQKLFKNEVNVVASLVEDAQTFAHFWDMNIRYFQGYFIHRPNNVILHKSFEGETLEMDR